MRLQQLRYFVETAISTSIIKASERLYTTPQNISKTIIQLENELGGRKLFYRLKNGMFLTDEGLIVFEIAQNIIQQSEKLSTIFTHENTIEVSPKFSAKLNILTVPLFLKMTTTILNHMTNRSFFFEEILISQMDILQMHSLLSQKTEECLKNYDLLIFSIDHEEYRQFVETYRKDFIIYRLYTDQICLEVKNDDSLSEYSIIPLSVLETLPIFTYASDALCPTFLERTFLKRGVKLRVVYRIPSSDNRQFCALHNAYNFIGVPTNELYPNLGYRCIPVEGRFLTDHFLFIPRKKASLEAVKLFVRKCDDIFSIVKLA